jgi:hypothetical protein
MHTEPYELGTFHSSIDLLIIIYFLVKRFCFTFRLNDKKYP